eukprot:699824-Amphidinium_carterae.1
MRMNVGGLRCIPSFPSLACSSVQTTRLEKATKPHVALHVEAPLITCILWKVMQDCNTPNLYKEPRL